MAPGSMTNLIVIGVLGVILGARAWAGRHRGLAALCFALALWASSLAVAGHPGSRAVGERMLMLGFGVPVALLRAASEAVQAAGAPAPRWAGAWPRRLGWLIGGFFAVTGALWPGLWLTDGGQQPGPYFALMFGAAAVLSSAPLLGVLMTLRKTAPEGRERLRYLFLAGSACTYGGGLNVLAFLTGAPSAAGLNLAVLGLGLLAWVVHTDRLPAFGRFVEASMRYSLAAAALTTAYLFAVLVLWPGTAERLRQEASWSSALQLFLLVLVGQPVLGAARAAIAARLLPGHGDLEGMARALAQSEAVADQHKQLAELGALSGAVAHELRNPLGVMRASARVLRGRLRDDLVADAALSEIDAQIDRAAGFVDELLDYGRPAGLVRREVQLADTAALAWSESSRALSLPGAVAFSVEGEAPAVSGDLSQLLRLFIVLIENARLAQPEGGAVRVRLRASADEVEVQVEDDGPGVPPALIDQVFGAFVSGRPRSGPRPGTGLGLAIARGVAERHGGRLSLLRPGGGGEGGACFVLRLPIREALPAGL